MKTRKTFLISLAVVLAFFSSCKEKHEGHEEPAMSIDYDAAYVVNGQGNNLSVVRLSDHVVTGTLSLSGATYPHHVYLSPDKQKLAVAITATDLSGGHGGHGGGTEGFKVLVLDAKSGSILKTISLPKMPHNAIFSPNGQELWVGQASEPTSTVAIYSASNYNLLTSIQTGASSSEVTFSADGTKAYVANTDDNSVTVIDAAAKTVLTTIAVGGEPVGAWPGSDGKMYIDNEAGQSITVIDNATLEIDATIALGFKPGYAAWHQGRGELWVSNATNGRVEIFKNNGTDWSNVATVPTGTDAHAIAFSQDGTMAFVTNQGSATLSVIDVANRAKVKDVAVGDAPNGLTIRSL